MKYCCVCQQSFEDSLSFCPADGSVLEEDSASLVNTVLDGQYRIEGILGKGGMGAVYKARHILLGDRVAIKVLPPEMRSHTEWLRRFQREGQAARRFRHPNAVTVYDLRAAGDGTIYLVMELVEGKTLDAELKKRGRFSPSEAFEILEPIMSVLNAAHAMGVVHRDLKPENIMISSVSGDRGAGVKLLDLGIAKMREVAGVDRIGATALTTAGQMLGTPYYMSPEQWGELPRDGSSEIDGRTDLYSLGVVLYELCAGKRPFGGKTLLELRRHHVNVSAPPLHEVISGVPLPFSLAVARAMSKDRGDRQATAAELAVELKTALEAASEAPTVRLSRPPAATRAVIATEARGGEITNADLSTPTVVIAGAHQTTVEGPAATDGQNAPASTRVQTEVSTMPTVVVRDDGSPVRGTGETVVAAVPAPTVSAPAAATAVPLSVVRRRSPLLFIGVAAVALLLVIGVAGFGVYRRLATRQASRRNTEVATKTDGTAKSDREVATEPGHSGTAPAGDAGAGAHEIARYWFEIDTPNKSEAIRAGDLVTMRSGQAFTLHFSPSESGYVYLIGPGANNVPTTFLTARARAGSKTNEAESGVDFGFPSITLDQTAGMDDFTVIFSPAQLARPQFLTGPPAHALTGQEQKELDDFRARYRANTVGIERVNSGRAPFASVKVAQTKEENDPVVFQFRIEHK
jgi:serine/threonine-protein kinase